MSRWDSAEVSATNPISVLPSARVTRPRQTDLDEAARISGKACDGTSQVSTSIAAPPDGTETSTGTGDSVPTRSSR